MEKISEQTQNWKDLANTDANQAADELSKIPVEDAVKIISEAGINHVIGVLSKLSTDLAVRVLRNLTFEVKEKILSKLDEEKSADLKELLFYPEGTAGSIMAKEVLSIPAEYTIEEATKYLRSIPQGKKGKISYIYVVDQNRRLEGVIQVRDLVFYSQDKSVKEILRAPVVQVETGMTKVDVARLLQRHRYLGLPVVDAEQKLVGVISADNALQVLEEDAVDEIAGLAGISAKEMRTASIKNILYLRLPWLFVNIASGLICAYISGIFQANIQTITAIFFFVPVILGLSESIGVQSSTIVVRNITMGQITSKDFGSVIFREITVGVFIGLVCGAIVGAFAVFWKGLAELGLIIAISMILTILTSAGIGLGLPLLFKRLNFDPALASGPVVLAICDIQTLFVYFNIAGFIISRLN